MNELEQSFQNKTISDNTKRNYNYAYDKLMNITNNELISDLKDYHIVRLMKTLDIPTMSKNGMISVAINILKAYNKPTASLEKYRETLKTEHYTNKKNDTVTMEKLVTIKQLKDYTKQLYKDEKYIDYIINYLLVNYGVRNQDLDLMLVSNKSQVNDTDNFIYPTTKYVVAIINKYKTSSSYGKKKFTIYTSDMIKAVKKLLSNKEQFKLINAVDINGYIQSRTLNSMGETLIFKSIISELASNNDIDKIQQLSKTRSTDVNTIFKDYHIKI